VREAGLAVPELGEALFWLVLAAERRPPVHPPATGHLTSLVFVVAHASVPNSA